MKAGKIPFKFLGVITPIVLTGIVAFAQTQESSPLQTGTLKWVTFTNYTNARQFFPEAGGAAAEKSWEMNYRLEMARWVALNKRLQSLVIPQVKLSEASFDSAVEYLRQRAEISSGTGTKLNVVMLVPPEVCQSRKITLDLENIPFFEALRYVCDQANIDFNVEHFGIVVAGKKMAMPMHDGVAFFSVNPNISSCVIPQIHLHEAALCDALKLLKQKLAKVSGSATNVNFVEQIPAEAQSTPVTLDLVNIPFLDALRYICYQADAKYSMQQYAIVISRVGK